MSSIQNINYAFKSFDDIRIAPNDNITQLGVEEIEKLQKLKKITSM